MREVIFEDGESVLELSPNDFDGGASYGVFGEDRNIEKVYFGRNITYGGYYGPFVQYSNSDHLQIIEIGPNVTSLDYYRMFSNNSKIRLVKCLATIPPGSYFHSDTYTYGILCVPDGAKEAYSTAKYWKDFKTIISETDVIEGDWNDEISWSLNIQKGELTIKGNGDMPHTEIPWKNYEPLIKSVVMEKNVTSIIGAAFAGCTGLTSVNIPNKVTSIGSRAFDGCINLKTVICHATTPPNVDLYGGAFTSPYPMLKVPESAIDVYSTNDYWKKFSISSFTYITDTNYEIPASNYIPGEIEYTRTGTAIKENKYGSFCFPFDIDLSHTDCYKKVYTPVNICFYNTKTGYINLFFEENPLSSILPANTPFIAQLTGTDVVLSNCSELSITEELTDPEPTNIKVFNYNGSDGALLQNTDLEVKFGGIVNPKDTETGMYSFNTDGSFSPSSTTLKPFRAYVLKNALSSQVKGITALFGDSEDIETAIKKLKEDPTSCDSQIYTLDGKALSEDLQNLPKGIYIVNGKKIMK